MEKKSILVTGGAGYIGSHTVWALLEKGYKVVVLDNLSTGNAFCLPSHVPFIQGNVGDFGLVKNLLHEFDIGGVLHFAGSIVVPESLEKPLLYYRNNTLNTHSLVQACVESGVKTFLFSSTAAVYGIPEEVPIDENAPLNPINPYGRSKMMVETMLRDVASVQDFKYACLRYFNVAGADPDGRTGQCSVRATHLIKVAAQVALGLRPHLTLYGRDYPTEDGTCIRDYIHVTDLARAHVAALSHLEEGGASFLANCGYGQGYSVLEIVRSMERILGRRLPLLWADRRAGDPPRLVANSTRLKKLTHWNPQFADLKFILRTALEWEQRLWKKAA